MKDDKMTLDDFHAKCIREYELQKRSAILPPITFLYWVGHLQEYYCHAAFGGAGYLPKLDPNECDTGMIYIDGDPHLRIDAKWGRPEYAKQKVALDDFFTCIPHMSTKMQVTDRCAHVQMTLDLAHWPSLLTSVLWEKLYYGLVHTETNKDLKEFCLSKATKLLEHFYPHVNIAGLRIGAELGMIDYEQEIFPEWFRQHCELQIVQPAQPPNDIYS